jgi:hypothetical protein
VRAIRADTAVAGFKSSLQPALAVDKVRHVGEPVAMCVASTCAEAEDIASRIEIDFDPLPAVHDMLAARAAGAPPASRSRRLWRRWAPSSPPRSFAADAHEHHGSGHGPTGYKVVARLIRARKAGSPLIVIPTAPSVQSCSEQSRCGLARAEYAARSGRRPTLTAPARAGFVILRVGAKKRDSK